MWTTRDLHLILWKSFKSPTDTLSNAHALSETCQYLLLSNLDQTFSTASMPVVENERRPLINSWQVIYLPCFVCQDSVSMSLCVFCSIGFAAEMPRILNSLWVETADSRWSSIDDWRPSRSVITRLTPLHHVAIRSTDTDVMDRSGDMSWGDRGLSNEVQPGLLLSWRCSQLQIEYPCLCCTDGRCISYRCIHGSCTDCSRTGSSCTDSRCRFQLHRFQLHRLYLHRLHLHTEERALA